jgi:hypothetical protein
LDVACRATRGQVAEALGHLTPAELATLDEALRLLGGIFKDEPAVRQPGNAPQLLNANVNKGQQ